jgi:hypothetical protein
MGTDMMMPLILAAAAANSAATDTAASGPMIALVAGEDGSQCLPDRSLCLDIPAVEDGDAAAAVLRVSSPGVEEASLPLPDLGEAQTVTLWPRLIAGRNEGAAPRYLVGILTGQSSMYSGGGGSASQLHLLELDRRAAAPALGGEALVVPWEGSLLIRACFSEEDMKDRLEACHDEYDFGATLAAAPAGRGVFPTLSYRAVATAFPRTSRRSMDNSDKPLKRADLVRAQDPACTYDRVLRYDLATSRYEMDRPAPDCSDYTTP